MIPGGITPMSSVLGFQQGDGEHEVNGAEIPLEDDGTDSVNSDMPKEDKLKDLDMIKQRFEEIEQEAKILREKQATLEKEIAEEKGKEPSAYPANLAEKKEVDYRSIYVGNVDYECTAEELQAHFNSCGTVNRVTILTNEFGMPKGFAYVEFAEVEAVQAALALNETVIHGRQIKVAPKRTNVPGMTQFRGPRGCPGYPYPDTYDSYDTFEAYDEYGPVRRTRASYRYTPY